MAMGSPVAPNPAGWELGVYDVQLTETGRELLARIKNGGGKIGLVVEGEEKGEIDTSEVLREQEVLVSLTGKVRMTEFFDLLRLQSIQQVVRPLEISLIQGFR